MSAIPHIAANDDDASETREWLDALEGVLEREGPERAHFLLEATQATPSSLSKPRLRLVVLHELTRRSRSSTTSTLAWMNTSTSPSGPGAAL